MVAQVAWEQLDVDTVTFVPAGEPWQKVGSRITPAKVRAAMVAAAIEGVDQFDLDLREVDHTGPTFTIDTISSFHEDVILILGADSAAGIGTWHRSAELLRHVEVAVVGRPGVNRSEVEEAVGNALRWLDMPALDVSSSELRAWMGAGFSARFVVPDAVRAVIVEHGLYLPERNDTAPVD